MIDKIEREEDQYTFIILKNSSEVIYYTTTWCKNNLFDKWIKSLPNQIEKIFIKSWKEIKKAQRQSK